MLGRRGRTFALGVVAGVLAIRGVACSEYGETGSPNVPRDGGGGGTAEGGGGAPRPGEDGSFAWAAGDAGEDAPVSAPTTRSPGKIECGSAQCTGGQRCCIESGMSCGSSCSTIGETRCDEPADCDDGQKCCTTERYGYISGSICTASCAHYTVCFVDGDCGNDKKCLAAPAPMPGPYKVCQ